VTAVLPAAPAVRPAPTVRLLRALARPEARRILRSPVVWLGVGLTFLSSYDLFHGTEDWPGAKYWGGSIALGPLLVATSMAVAASFHRERVGLAPDTPVGEATRTWGRLLGAGALVGLVALLALGGAVAARGAGGFPLGEEPGRTLHAHYTLAEVLQPVALAVLAVATGAAAGRRLRHRAAAHLVLFVGWFPFVLVAWAFQSPDVTPFSIIQVQPITVPAGPAAADPTALPATWLLSAPNEYQDYWGRLFVSADLAAWHVAWLLGLAGLFFALALPAGHRRWPATVGLVLAVAGVAGQYAVIP
jgi:hypothetical protein